MTTKNNEHIYHCKYGLSLECGEFKKGDVNTDEHGLTDAFIMVSILRMGDGAHKGASSTVFLSFDGQNNGESIPDTEFFSTWVLMASRIADMPDVQPWQREIAKAAFEATRKAITGIGTH